MPEPYRINITHRASADLTAIFEFISQSSLQGATGVIRRLLDDIDGLELMPARYRIAGRSRKHGNHIHACVSQPFIIYYRVDEHERIVFILEVRHGTRRQPRRFR